MMMMMMKMMKMMMLFVSFLSHFSATFPLKGCVCEPGENGTNTTRLINMLWIIRNKPTSSVNLRCACLCECQCIVQLDINSLVIQVKESKREMLGDECMKLVKDLSVMEDSGDSASGGPPPYQTTEPPFGEGDTSGSSIVTLLVGASVFITFLLLCFTLFKRPETEAGGVIGSLIHYPPAWSLENTMKQENLLPETKMTY
ncbi:uncharacterized protein LOC132871385 isoform X1 [Neoarius graeffei]|uniref:uncharacterized protein LOC132871385 isoform X1 n=1 Tax=Neoarius graeffei TaxID=443677 RepID=UPI00298CE3E3|nr:uncharacterized protein LOC132871385 isoform X1 [Neoarius graeffei]